MQGLIRDLDRSGIDLDSIEVHRPTLDDVFLTLTGRSLRDAESGAAGPATRRDRAHATDDTDQPGRTATAPTDVPEGALQ